jgi:hypothetical protein
MVRSLLSSRFLKLIELPTQLNGGALDGAHLTVHSDVVHQDEEETPHIPGSPPDQSDKPRAASKYYLCGT